MESCGKLDVPSSRRHLRKATVKVISAADIEMLGAACGIIASLIVARIVAKAGRTMRRMYVSHKWDLEHYATRHPDIMQDHYNRLSVQMLRLIVENLRAISLSIILYFIFFVCFFASAMYRYFALT